MISSLLVVTAGGRVLAVSAYAPTLNEALEAVYAGVEEVAFEGIYFGKQTFRLVPFFLVSTFPLSFNLGGAEAFSFGLTEKKQARRPCCLLLRNFWTI
jgi:hypothetical protein